jgi:sigma-B regulation protein RsbU (phosphoserine phosphatase)
VFICDVAGHGVRSALVTAMIRALVEELKPEAGDPGQFLTKLNRELTSLLKHSDPPMLTTAIHLVVDYETGILRFANAGHPKPLHIRRAEGTVKPLASPGGRNAPGLGLSDDAVYQTAEHKLAPRDLIMLFTDGLYDVEHDETNAYSQALVASKIAGQTALSAHEMFDKLLLDIQSLSPDGKFCDDVCIVGVEVLKIGRNKS